MKDLLKETMKMQEDGTWLGSPKPVPPQMPDMKVKEASHEVHDEDLSGGYQGFQIKRTSYYSVEDAYGKPIKSSNPLWDQESAKKFVDSLVASGQTAHYIDADVVYPWSNAPESTNEPGATESKVKEIHDKSVPTGDREEPFEPVMGPGDVKKEVVLTTGLYNAIISALDAAMQYSQEGYSKKSVEVHNKINTALKMLQAAEQSSGGTKESVNEQSNAEGTCPACGSYELEYGWAKHDADADGNIYYPFKCNKCHRKGKEWYSVNFLRSDVDPVTPSSERVNEQGFGGDTGVDADFGANTGKEAMREALRAFIAAGDKLSQVWDNDYSLSYPSYLPSFDEFIAEFSGLMEEPEDAGPSESKKHKHIAVSEVLKMMKGVKVTEGLEGEIRAELEAKNITSNDFHFENGKIITSSKEKALEIADILNSSPKFYQGYKVGKQIVVQESKESKEKEKVVGDYKVQLIRKHDSAVPYKVKLIKGGAVVDMYETDGSQDAQDKFSAYVKKASEKKSDKVKEAKVGKDQPDVYKTEKELERALGNLSGKFNDELMELVSQQEEDILNFTRVGGKYNLQDYLEVGGRAFDVTIRVEQIGKDDGIRFLEGWTIDTVTEIR